MKPRPGARWPRAASLCLALAWALVVPVLAQELTPEMLDEAVRRTGLSREEILARVQEGKGGARADADSLQDEAAPGRNSLVGIDDSLGADGAAPRWRDSDAAVVLPWTAELTAAGLVPDGAVEDPAGDLLRHFGSDFFHLDAGVFTPPSFGPVSPDYRLGVGDELVINAWGEVEFQVTRVVDRDGSIILPQGGMVHCAGRSLAEVGRAVRTGLGKAHAGIDPDGPEGPAEGNIQVETILGRLRAIKVFVVGEAVRPGSYELNSASRILTALYAAGGPLPTGSFREIRLVRGEAVVAVFDLYDYLLGGSRAADALLQEGDSVFIPDVGPMVQLRGEVRRPMSYEMKVGETIGDLIRFAGGFTAAAAPEMIHIQRILPPGERRPGEPDHSFLDIRFDPQAMLPATGQVIKLLDGDRITIDGVATRLENWVKISGQVKRPATYGFQPGMTVSQLVALAGGLWPDALLDRSVVDRIGADLTLTTLAFPLGEVLAGRAPDVPLQARDEVSVFSRWDIQSRPQVHISGEVFKPHGEDYRQGMTLRDLILKAEGLKPGADRLRAEVARLDTLVLQMRGDGERSAKTVRIVEVELSDDFLTAGDGFALQPWDRVTIRRLPWWEMQRTVALLGEVYYPGTYSLEHKDERLSSLVRRAGGLKPEAYLVGARIQRDRDGVGNIAIDLASALAQPGSQYDLILEEGDRIVIPDRLFTVKVLGEVGFPTSLVWEDGRNIDYYVDRAGGYLEKADKDKSRVIYPNGLSLPNKGGSKVVAGSTIIVPTQPPPEGPTTLETLKEISAILAGLATVWLVIDRTN